MKDKIIEFFYKMIKIPYQLLFKRVKPWGISVESLLLFDAGTLGNDLGLFFKNNAFEVQDSLEEHDVFHVLTTIGTTVKEEVDLQFYLLGNGKRSPFTLLVILTGIVFYPIHYNSFRNCYKRGKNAYLFYDLEFYKLLHRPTVEIKSIFNIK
ncbi:hypothetical protein DI487_15790 [Flavobacterium sediminis]|uniref:Ubiquinone biosynthesis protein COQ4 n=1 Tax=Flavobacterium sediminis TaxID=2201181 RepID=A0A2U8QZ36_9FLAO|nr:hypothetical protein [Flavobacterium sediminis]AWM15176.1 hypothetical protein DI487_15790 [Flavobacterium sediminis]